MRIKALHTILFSLALVVSGCTSTSLSSRSTDDSFEAFQSERNGSQLVGSFKEDWSGCVEGIAENTQTCTLGYLVSNRSNSVVEVTAANVYAVIDGKIYKADSRGLDTLDTDFISQTWNPSEELKTASTFTMPTGATVERIFWSDEANESSAGFTVSVGYIARS